jgi:hypothetical protein
MTRSAPLALAVALLLAGAAGCTAARAPARVAGERKVWHPLTLTFTGPRTSETAEANPFRNCRLTVTFAHGDRTIAVPGYFAADGDAAESGAEAGTAWRVHFTPDAEGEWTWTASFRTGNDVALSGDPDAGTPTAFDGAKGTFRVGPTDKTGRDFRARGLLRHTGGRYLTFAATGARFLKGGADSPENFLAYADFDNTYRYRGEKQRRKGEARAEGLHRYGPHVRDWRRGDPSWRGGKGKGIIGALNYLASQEMNSVYFLTMNVAGDGKDVWPWTEPTERFRFDCSKLAQWEIVFSHMDRLGLMMHVITQEQENDQLLDGGRLGPERRLYYRELIARFAHHPALVWNLGEENTNTTEQRKAFCRYIKALDPYDHPIVCHTFPGKYDEVYRPLLGFEAFDGPSLQTNDTHTQTLKWVRASAGTDHPWFVCLDEIGPAHTGVKPDADDPQHDAVRTKHLWGNLMAGGAGVEWYFGYKWAHNDLNCEDWRSRENMWRQTRIALAFFREHLPFWEMTPDDGLVSGTDGWCLAKPGEVWAVYLPKGGEATLDLGDAEGPFAVRWYDPRAGGDLRQGSVARVEGPGKVRLGRPPEGAGPDWAALVRRTDHR